MACEPETTINNQQLSNMKNNIDVFNEVVTSDQIKTPSLASDGESKYTLTGLNQLFGLINAGDYANGTVLNEVWDYAYNTATGIGYKVKSKSSLPYAIDATTYPDPEDDPNLKRTGDASREWVKARRRKITPYDFFVNADGVNDDYEKLQEMIDYAILNKYAIEIGPANFACSGKLIFTEAVDFICDAKVNWYFTTPGDAGFKLDFTGTTNRHLFKMSFGSYYSPAVPQGVIPGYPGGQDTSSRTDPGLEIIGANRFDIEIQAYQGWEDGILLKSAPGRNVENYNIKVNTHDWNTNAITFDVVNGTNNAGTVKYNTMGMAKNQFRFDDNLSGNKITSLHAECTGQCFIKEFDAAAIYSDGLDILHDSYIKINWLYAGARAGVGETPPEVTSDILLPFIAGTQSSNGFFTDGTDSAALLGYFTGTRNEIEIGAIFGSPKDSVTFNAGGPSAGDPIRVRIASQDNIQTNKVRIKGADYDVTQIPKQLTPTLDESTYNGGIGSASIFNREHVQLTTVGSIAAGATETFYMFHQLSTNVGSRPIQVIDSDGAIAFNKAAVSAEWEGTTNRAVKVTIRNLDTVAMPASTNVNFYLDFTR